MSKPKNSYTPLPWSFKYKDVVLPVYEFPLARKDVLLNVLSS